MILFIDTTNSSLARFVLMNKQKIRQKIYELKPAEQGKTVMFLADFLKKNKITPPHFAFNKGRRGEVTNVIDKVVVNAGPGSFSGVRVGVTIAQALGYALGIPVAAIKKRRSSGNLRKVRQPLKPSIQLFENFFNQGLGERFRRLDLDDRVVANFGVS